MYTKSQKIQTSKAELSNYIPSYDVYNSTLLSYLGDPNITKERYEINLYEFRPDLIAKEYYGSQDYTGLVILQSGIGLESFRKGVVIELVPKDVLDSLISRI